MAEVGDAGEEPFPVGAGQAVGSVADFEGVRCCLVVMEQAQRGVTLVEDCVQHGLVGFECRVLWEIRDASTFGNHHASAIRGFNPGNDSQQCRFPGAVGPDEAHLLIVSQPERHRLQQRLHSVALAQGFDGEDVHRGAARARQHATCCQQGSGR